MSDDLTHFDEAGRAQMVDVGAKSSTERRAVAVARVEMQPETLELIRTGGAKKGDVLGVARVAGIMGSKRTADLIPLCHPIPLTKTTVEFALGHSCVWIRTTAKSVGRTGVEMEALTAASVAALTIYDMCKAVDRAMSFGPIFLQEKSGGKSGDFVNNGPDVALPEDLAWR